LAQFATPGATGLGSLLNFGGSAHGSSTLVPGSAGGGDNVLAMGMVRPGERITVTRPDGSITGMPGVGGGGGDHMEIVIRAEGDTPSGQQLVEQVAAVVQGRMMDRVQRSRTMNRQFGARSG